MSRITAYVTTETCRVRDAVRPGTSVGRDQVPVSRHGDYSPWTYGKHETLALIDDGTTYQSQTAQAVARLMGWRPGITATATFLAWAKRVTYVNCQPGDRWDDPDMFVPYGCDYVDERALADAIDCWRLFRAGDRVKAAESLVRAMEKLV